MTAAAGLQPGQPVALLLRNAPYFLEALLAVAAIGGIPAPLNWRWSLSETCAALRMLRPFGLLADAACAASFDLATLARHISGSRCILLGPGHPENGRHQDAGPHQSEGPRQDEGLHQSGQTLHAEQLLEGVDEGVLQLAAPQDGTALICFTSGTTGGAKGVCLSHAALDFQAQVKVDVVGYRASDVYLHIAPLCHIGGLVSALAMLLVGATHVFPSSFPPASTAELVVLHNVTSLIAVPAMIADLAANPQQQMLPSVRRLLLGGGELPARLHAAMKTLFPSAEVMTAYGMTEAASSITYRPLFPTTRPGEGNIELPGACVGMPPAGIEIMIRRLDDEPGTSPTQHNRRDASETDVNAGQASRSGNVMGHAKKGVDGAAEVCSVGEVLTRGAHLMSGYWRQNMASREAFLTGGWFRTGDLGCIGADGSLWLAGRLKDVVRSGSENVNAAEVEKALGSHPAILAAAVVGLPHDRLGEQVAALVVLDSRVAWRPASQQQQTACSSTRAPPSTTSHNASLLESMQQHCRQQGLTSFRLPRILYGQHEPLPVNSSGKVVKRKVRERLLELARPDRRHDNSTVASRL